MSADVIQAGDALVLAFSQDLTPEQASNIRGLLLALPALNDAVVVSGCAGFAVVRHTPPAPACGPNGPSDDPECHACDYAAQNATSEETPCTS